MATCMPGMVMPGCSDGSTGSSIGHLAVTPGIRSALLVVLGLALLGLLLFLWRLWRHRLVNGYPWVADWLGHGGVHAVGMILMSTLMLGWLPSIGPAWAYLVVYGALALLFGARTVMARDASSRSDDLWHVFAQLSMVYMFGALWLGSVVALTAAFLVLYGVFMAEGVWQGLRMAGPDARLRPGHRSISAAGTIGHLVISGSMVLMFVVMQWPGLFG